MLWFLDTEFLDDGKTIELISLGLVSDDDTMPEYYAESDEFDWETRGTAWLRQHVAPHLKHGPNRRSRARIAEDVRQLLLCGDKPEFWAYFAAYDWVVLCQLYGPMIAVPPPFPHRCNELAQLMKTHDVSKAELPLMPTTHNALDDARWNRSVYRYIVDKCFGP